MSTAASIFALFKSPPSAGRLAEIEEILANRHQRPVESAKARYCRLAPVPGADLRVDVTDEGMLHFLGVERYDKLIGVPSMDDRLFEIGYPTRWWSESYAEGPVIEYAITMLCLLSQADVSGVWYSADNYDDGACLAPMTHDQVHELIDAFVAVGNMRGGRPARYIFSQGGHVIEDSD